MIKSMTGFGRGEFLNEDIRITVEVKSVNHRYLDATIKLPKKFNFYDAMLRSKLKEGIERGKVDVYVTYEDLQGHDDYIQYNKSIAKQYLDYYRQMAVDFDIPDQITNRALGSCPDVFTVKELQEDNEMEKPLLEAFDMAVKALVESREREGANLKANLLDKLNRMSELVSYIEQRSPDIVSEYKERLTQKIAELLDNANVDESRIAMEVTIFADKMCVDEELVRIKSHIQSMKDILNKGGSVGRKLDFMTQEMNREANTILSKSTDLSITDTGIEIKTTIEMIREQIQNIE